MSFGSLRSSGLSSVPPDPDEPMVVEQNQDIFSDPDQTDGSSSGSSQPAESSMAVDPVGFSILPAASPSDSVPLLLTWVQQMTTDWKTQITKSEEALSVYRRWKSALKSVQEIDRVMSPTAEERDVIDDLPIALWKTKIAITRSKATLDEGNVPAWAYAFYPGEPHNPSIKCDPILNAQFLEACFKAWDRTSGVPVTLDSFFDHALGVWLANHTQNDIPVYTQPFEFQGRYEGQSVDWLHGDLLRMTADPEKDRHALVMAILQSSGSGKTRTAVQLSTKALGLYVCVRNPDLGDGIEDVSHPPSDTQAYDTLGQGGLANWRSGSADALGRNYMDAKRHIAVACWLKAYAEVMLEHLREQATSQNVVLEGIQGPDWDSLVSKIGSEIISDILTPSLATVSDCSNNMRSPTRLPASSQVVTPRKQLLDKIAIATGQLLNSDVELNETLREICQQAKPNLSPDVPAKLADLDFSLSEWLEPSFKALHNNLPEGSERRYTFIAIDEAFSMGTVKCQAIRRIFSKMKEIPFWVLFIDTNNKVLELIGVDGETASMRVLKGIKTMPEPFVSLPHDLFVFSAEHKSTFRKIIRSAENNSVISPGVPITHQTLLDFLPRMGRPLWNDYEMKLNRVWEKLMNRPELTLPTIPTKVVGKKSPGIVLSPEPIRGLLVTAASVRLPLDMFGVQGSSSGTSFAALQIQCHLRTVTDVMDGSFTIKSHNCSEPVLSLATADWFRTGAPGSKFSSAGWKPGYAWSHVILALVDSYKNHQINLGESGEEAVRIIVSIACDLAAIRPSIGVSEVDSGVLGPHLHLINVKDWLESMIVVDKGKSEARETLKWAQDQWINMTHFGRLGRQYRATKKLPHVRLALAWLRQMALLGVVNQPTWDILIPTYHSVTRPTFNQPFHPRHISAIAIQVKNQKEYSAATADWTAELTESVKRHPLSEPRASLGIFFSLRAQDTDNGIRWENAVDVTDTHSIYVGGFSRQYLSALGALEEKAEKVLFDSVLNRTHDREVSHPYNYIKRGETMGARQALGSDVEDGDLTETESESAAEPDPAYKPDSETKGISSSRKPNLRPSQPVSYYGQPRL